LVLHWSNTDWLHGNIGAAAVVVEVDETAVVVISGVVVSLLVEVVCATVEVSTLAMVVVFDVVSDVVVSMVTPAVPTIAVVAAGFGTVVTAALV
jgi:hypothetical protein